MTIHIVMYKFWDDIFICDVFGTEQGARDYIAKQGLPSRFYVEPWSVR